MKSSIERADQRAQTMLDLISNVVYKVSGVTPSELKSKSYAHRITKARFIFAELCNGTVNPLYVIAEYLNKNVSMVSYYKKSHDECYKLYEDFKLKSDMANKMFIELLTNTNGNFDNVFQEEGE